jgi:glycolate oxidase FAD binding subunit
LIDGLEDEAAVQALSRALGSPFDVTGAAHVPVGLDGHPVTMIRLEGFAGSVAYRAEQMAALFAGHSVRIERDPEAIRAGWRYIRDVEPMQAVSGNVWRLSVKPSDAPGLVARSGAVQSMYDWGGGLVWLLVESGTDLRAKLGAFDGHATLVRASEDTRRRLPVFQPEAAPIAAIAQGLRAKFDPKGLLNPGRMG